jgi:hypothetical protein
MRIREERIVTKTLYARFDGEALHPEEKLPLAPETRVLITIEADEKEEASSPEIRGEILGFDERGEIRLGEPYSALRFMASLELEGPVDWSERWEDYLHSESEPKDE